MDSNSEGSSPASMEEQEENFAAKLAKAESLLKDYVVVYANDGDDEADDDDDDGGDDDVDDSDKVEEPQPGQR